MKQRSTAPLSERLELVAFLGGVSLFLSTVEYLLPKPVPFLRIGIANLPLLIALDLLSPVHLLLLATLKVIGQGLLTGTLFSYVIVFSAAGTFASVMAMLAARRVAGRRIGLIGLAVTGALCSNLSQIALARLLVFGASAWLIAPPFLAVGTVAATALGWFAERFSASSRWLASLRGGA